MRNVFKKYLFGILVATYLLSAAGIPVYLHYCGGELEEVNYVVKSNSCCGGEEDDTADNGCCNNENLVIKNATDFTIKDFQHHDFVKTVCELFFVQLPFSIEIQSQEIQLFAFQKEPPSKVQNSLVISTSVLRI